MNVKTCRGTEDVKQASNSREQCEFISAYIQMTSNTKALFTKMTCCSLSVKYVLPFYLVFDCVLY
ncbi:hypothetical protein E2C01_039040 [Portunus trituberculatus]|uniref:Uncharacterized protein n=1 Tax=Portunus trituberculatus TaxID=210409 RepID=A0A5B7FFS8_PORTR|nr:hypothetical protein [Portunus trituberculatus]